MWGSLLALLLPVASLQGLPGTFLPCQTNAIHAQPRAAGRLSCGCSSPAFSCHNIDTKQKNSDGKPPSGSGRQTHEEKGSPGCSQAVLPAGDAACRLRSGLTPAGANVCIGRASSRSLSHGVGGGVAHLPLCLQAGSH